MAAGVGPITRSPGRSASGGASGLTGLRPQIADLHRCHNNVIAISMGRARIAENVRAVDLRQAMLDVAARILGDEGLPALSVRRVAAEVGASTMVVYTHFRDKDGLVDAAIAASFDRFAAALAAVHDPDPWLHLRAIGQAYRGFAAAHPSWYRLLFGRSRPGRKMPSSSDRAFGVLTRAVGRLLADLDRSARDIEPLALNVWSATHGLVSLELAGVIAGDEADAAYERLLSFIEAAIRGA